jgi:hypothetical protein
MAWLPVVMVLSKLRVSAPLAPVLACSCGSSFTKDRRAEMKVEDNAREVPWRSVDRVITKRSLMN